ncbi:Peroxisome biogenesis factor 10 [Bienertia sinuspersici]
MDDGSSSSTQSQMEATSSTQARGLLRGFAAAAPPEIMRAAEKDDNYASFVSEACRDAFRHLFGARVAVAYHSETKLLGQMLYYILTTGAGQQTLGEEYCSYGLPPTPARRALFILYQTAVPYMAERMSSRMASRGMFLAESHSYDFSDRNTPVGSQLSSETPSSSTSQTSTSSLSRLKERYRQLQLYIIQRWPTVLPAVRDVLQLILRTNLMFFYFEGLYYHISKRASGVRYMFIGKPLNQRPSYVSLLPKDYGAVIYLHWKSARLASIGTYHHSTGGGLPVLNEEGDPMTADSRKTILLKEQVNALFGLGNREHPTATPCGHVNCIMEWCNEKPECPLCRTPLTHSSLVCLYHSDF